MFAEIIGRGLNSGTEYFSRGKFTHESLHIFYFTCVINVVIGLVFYERLKYMPLALKSSQLQVAIWLFKLLCHCSDKKALKVAYPHVKEKTMKHTATLPFAQRSFYAIHHLPSSCFLTWKRARTNELNENLTFLLPTPTMKIKIISYYPLSRLG